MALERELGVAGRPARVFRLEARICLFEPEDRSETAETEIGRNSRETCSLELFLPGRRVMKRRDFLKSSATLIGGAALGGSLTPNAAFAADAPVKGGTLIWGHSETTQNLDIHQTGTASTIRVLQNVHDAIVTVDKNFTVIPSLAKSFDQSRGRIDLHVPPSARREVPRWQDDDLGGRQIFLRPLPRQEDGRGQFRSVQRCRLDRNARRPHRRHQVEPRSTRLS